MADCAKCITEIENEKWKEIKQENNNVSMWIK